MSFSMPSQTGVPSSSDLKFMRDFRHSLLMVKASLLRKPVYLVLLLGLCILDGLADTYEWKIPGLTFGEEIVTLCIACGVIIETFAHLNPGFARPDNKEFNGAEARMVAVGFYYGFSVLVRLLLLIYPGIKFATTASLASVFACLENCNAAEAVKRSQALVKDQFGLTFRYIVLKPGLVFLLVVTLFVVSSLAVGLVFGDVQKPPAAIEIVLATLNSFVLSAVQLSVFSLMVRLYAFLSAADSSRSSGLPTTSSSAASSMPVPGAGPQPAANPSHHKDGELESKLTPRWDP